MAAAARAGKALGCLAADAGAAKAALVRGYRCLCISTDVGLMRDALAGMLAAARG